MAKRSVITGSYGPSQRVTRERKGDLAVTRAYKNYQPTGPYYQTPNDLRGQFAGGGSYVRTPSGAYPRVQPKPYRPMPAPTGTEAVVRPGVSGGQVRAISNVVRERPSPVPRARPASAPAPASRGVAPGTGGRMTRSQRDAPAGPTGRSTGRIGTRTGGVAPGTGGRMTRSQRDAPAGPRGGGGGGGGIGTRTGGVAAGTGGRQTQSQRNEPAGPRGNRR